MRELAGRAALFAPSGVPPFGRDRYRQILSKAGVGQVPSTQVAGGLTQ
mgnify:CR=1 FL=1